jgi:hypothetical protein
MNCSFGFTYSLFDAFASPPPIICPVASRLRILVDQSFSPLMHNLNFQHCSVMLTFHEEYLAHPSLNILKSNDEEFRLFKVITMINETEFQN